MAMSRKSRVAGETKLKSSGFPVLDLPIPIPFAPMEAKRQQSVPTGDRWQFEPKWDGFRAIVFRDGDTVAIQSKAGQPLTRYFPELIEALQALPQKRFVIDGEIVVPLEGRLSFDDLLLRIHPAESRVRKLAGETPAQLFVFDLLYDGRPGHKSLATEPLLERRARLEDFFERVADDSLVRLSPATTDRKLAVEWFEKFGAAGLDGVMAKLMDQPYHSGDREAMVKVKHLKTADCVVGGYRYGEGTRLIGSLLLGLYDAGGNLVFIGHTSAFNKKERTDLKAIVEPLRGDNPFSIRVPGGPSRWSSERSGQWEPLRAELVCEVEYDYFSQGRFRHGSRFLRWRPEKKAASCTMEQVLPPSQQKSRKSINSFF